MALVKLCDLLMKRSCNFQYCKVNVSRACTFCKTLRASGGDRRGFIPVSMYRVVKKEMEWYTLRR